MSTILLLAKLEKGTGNRTTAERITSHVTNNSCSTLLCDVGEFETCQDLLECLKQHEVAAILAIHAYRAGKLLKDVNVPFALIFGGTDVQCSSWNQQQQSIMAAAVVRAKLMVAFSSMMKARALQNWPNIKDNEIIVQRQGVKTGISSKYTFKDLFIHYQQPYILEHINELKIFLFVGGIREVKAPMFLMEALSNLHQNDPSINMVIIGPELDASYAASCKKKAETLAGIYMFTEIPPCQIHSLMHHSFALVNSSINEGMAGAILEAMEIGTPVLARHNDGNCSIITDGENGLLFNNVEEFVKKANTLLDDDQLRKRITSQAKNFIHTHHNYDNERKTYQSIVRTLLDCTPSSLSSL